MIRVAMMISPDSFQRAMPPPAMRPLHVVETKPGRRDLLDEAIALRVRMEQTHQTVHELACQALQMHRRSRLLIRR